VCTETKTSAHHKTKHNQVFTVPDEHWALPGLLVSAAAEARGWVGFGIEILGQGARAEQQE
jgi:hypothetical protein